MLSSSAYGEASRLSFAPSSDEEGDDPWAIRNDDARHSVVTLDPEEQYDAYSSDEAGATIGAASSVPEPSAPISSAASNDTATHAYTVDAHDDLASGRLPQIEPVAVHTAPFSGDGGDDVQSPKSLSAETDPWAPPASDLRAATAPTPSYQELPPHTPSTLADQRHPVARGGTVSGIPASSSAIRGFASYDRAASPYDMGRADSLAQKKTSTLNATTLGRTHQPGPFGSDEIIVHLRPELEGLIFKYNSYTIIRRPCGSDSDSNGVEGTRQGTANTATPSDLLLSSARQSRRRGKRASHEHSTSTGSSSFSPSHPASPYTHPGAKTVVRRYSDFAWLNDLLLKRYPFRLVPVLPPKRLGLPVAGRRLTSSSDGFIERRRRGLQRYLRALVTHPVLGNDDLVQVFLTERQSLAEWKANHSAPVVEEEALVCPASPSSLMSLPRDFVQKLETTAAQTPAMVEKWTALTTLLERLAKRLESQGLEYSRLASLVESLEETNQATYRPESEFATSVHDSGRRLSYRVAGAHRDLGDLCQVRSGLLLDATLEGLKAQRDLWLAFRDLLLRHQSLSGDSVSTLKASIAAARAKLSQLEAVPPASRAQTYSADVAKYEASIRKESGMVEALLKRRESIKVHMWEELGVLWERKTAAGSLAGAAGAGGGTKSGSRLGAGVGLAATGPGIPGTANVWRGWCFDELVGRSAERRAIEECWRELEEEEQSGAEDDTEGDRTENSLRAGVL